jgi:DNA-binding NtrC family response regulator
MEAKRILVIDDEPSTTTYLETLLRDHGFWTRSANNADEGMREMEKCRPDLILLDLLMPKRTGMALFRKITKDSRFKDIPIVIVTGIRNYFHEDHREFFESLKKVRPAAYLEKPVDPQCLIDTVREALGQKG